MAEHDHTPDWRLAAALSVVLAAAVFGPVIWAWSVADQLPEQVARHWGIDGGVTAVWSLTTQLVVLGVTSVIVAGTIGTIAVVGRMPLAIRRMMAGCAVIVATLMAGLQIDGLYGHLGLDDPFAAPSPGRGIVVGILVGGGLAVAGAGFASENVDNVRATAPPPTGLPRVAPGASAAEQFPAPRNRGVLAIGLAVLALTALTSLFAIHWPILIGLLVYVVIHLHVRFTVTVTRDEIRVGNRWLSMLTVPIEQIAAADTTTVDPFWEFGGWGLRVDTKGRTGVVIRKGSALRLTRGDGSEILITIDEPESAAATINTYADERFGAING